MIRAIFASGDTMNVLPAAVFLGEFVRWAICGIKSYPPDMIRADFRVRRAVCGIKSCPPDMIRAIFASGDTMNVLPAAVFLDECVRRAICGIKSCPPGMIRAIFASGDTMNVLPAAVFLDECVRRAVCGIKSCPPDMIRTDFRVRKAFCARRRPNNCSPVTMILSHTPVSVLFSPLFRKQRFVIAEYRS